MEMIKIVNNQYEMDEMRIQRIKNNLGKNRFNENKLGFESIRWQMVGLELIWMGVYRIRIKRMGTGLDGM